MQKLRDINIEHIEQFNCYECIKNCNHGPYTFISYSRSFDDYEYITSWLDDHNLKHLIGFIDYNNYLVGSNDCYRSDRIKLYCPIHNAAKGKLQYIECRDCFEIYYYMFNELINIFGMNIKIYCETQLPEHICNRTNMLTLLNNCKIDSRQLDDSVHEAIMEKLRFPNSTKSAANII